VTRSLGTPGRWRRAPRGFSFLEVFITAAVLLIGISALTQGVPIALRLIEHDRKLAIADRVAVTAIEELIAQETARTLHAGSGTDRYNARAQRDGVGPFVANWRVVDDFTVRRGRLIEITVVWDERGDTRRFTLTSFGFR
jgi:hypothetical protein